MQDFFHISFLGINTFELILLLTFSVLFLLRILYLFLVTGQIVYKRKQTCAQKADEPISLLLTYRNEEGNLLKYLPEILKIDNADFEVIAVDDFSQDNSLSVLGVMKSENGKLRVSSLNQETRFSEKLAQNIALKAAKNNWVMVIPVSLKSFESQWLEYIAGSLENGKDVIISYSNILPTGRFYNYLFRIELFWQQVKSAGYTFCGFPFTYTEENIAFRKEKYFEAGGYGSKIKEPFANLEIIINKFIQKKKVNVCFNKETSVKKNELVKRCDYYNLLKKSFRIERYLPKNKRTILIVDELTQLLFLPSIIFAIVFVSELWPLISIVVVVKISMHLFIIKRVLNHLNERKIFISSLIYELLMPYYKVFYRGHFNRQSRKQRWRSNI